MNYIGKQRKEVILNDTMSVPFQSVKYFGNIHEKEWANMLIFGDNLQVLKHLIKLKNELKLKNPDGSSGVKLIYIDPPFGTGDEYSANGANAYSAKLQGVKYLEFLRKRFIILQHLLTDDGILFIRIDHHFGHYVKILLDEIFGRAHFQNELIVNRIYKNVFGDSKFIPVSTDSIFSYFKTSKASYHYVLKEREKIRKEFWRHMDDSAGIRYPQERIVFGKKLMPPRNKHFKYNQESINRLISEGKIRLKCKQCGYIHCNPNEDWNGCKKCHKDEPRLEYLVEASSHEHLQSNWTDIPGYSNTTKYPTENSEVLLERIIRVGSKPGDIVLDCFAGSGTTGAVAEKLGRKWIMADCGKLAIYVMQNRMMNLKNKIGNKGKLLKHKPFILYNAGLYNDEDLIERMKQDKYKDFVLELFNCQKRKHVINGLVMHGTLNNHSVMIFDKNHYLTYDFINDLDDIIGNNIKKIFYIIAPAGIVGFNEDYINKNNINYVILRIPNSIIEYIKEKDFVRLKQPRSKDDINQTIDSVGFDFIYPPKVKAEYYNHNPKETLAENEYVIKIKEFNPVQIGSKIIEFDDPKTESLSMIMLDRNYDGDTFQLDNYYFGDEIAKNDFKIRLSEEIGPQLMIIYVDIFGNERKEIIKKSDFVDR